MSLKQNLTDLAEVDEELPSTGQTHGKDLNEAPPSAPNSAALCPTPPAPITSEATLGDTDGNRDVRKINFPAETSTAAARRSTALSADGSTWEEANTVEESADTVEESVGVHGAVDIEGTLKAAAEIHDLNATLSAIVGNSIGGDADEEIQGDESLVVTADLVHLEPNQIEEQQQQQHGQQQGKLPGGDC